MNTISLSEIYAAAGGMAKLAQALGIKRQAADGWKRYGRVPVERVLDVERVTGIPRERIRPDIYPPRNVA